MTYVDPKSVEAAISENTKDSSKPLIAVNYNPKDRKDLLHKSVNNIYVKNYPQSWGEAELKELFGKYGHIKSMII